MTIITTQSRITYAGDNVSTLFPIPFEFFLNSDIEVVKTAVSGAQSILVLGIDYTLAGAGVVGGGSATKTTALLTGETLTLFLNPPISQQSHYISNSPFPSATLENDIDRQTQISQRLQDQISRSVRAPDGDANPSMLLPGAAIRALKYAAFDGLGNAIVVPSLPAPTSVSPILVNQAPTGFFYGNNGANIQRFNDRVFIGDATVNDGIGPTPTVPDWLTAWQVSTVGIPFGRATSTQFASLATAAAAAVTSPSAGLFAARSFNANQSGQNFIALETYALNNSPTFANSAWGLYTEAHRVNNAVGATIGYEIDVTQRGSFVGITPYSQPFGMTPALQLASGAQQGLIATATFNGTVMTITNINAPAANGGIQVGYRVKFVGVDTTIASFGTGTGLAGTYNLAANVGSIPVGRIGAVSPMFDNTAAINIQGNPNSFATGINFSFNSIAGTDGVNGIPSPAIQLGRFHGLFWFASAAIGTASIYSDATASIGSPQVQLGQGNVNFLEQSSAGKNFQVALTTNAVNYPFAQGATAGNSATIGALGADANVDLGIFCQGTGIIKFVSASMVTANGAVATTMTSLGPAGAHTTIQEWLTWKNAAGVVRYTPGY
jgi:hypothetical protein